MTRVKLSDEFDDPMDDPKDLRWTLRDHSSETDALSSLFDDPYFGGEDEDEELEGEE